MVKKGFPEEDEFVICKVERINPNSVFVYLPEYDKEGMIHISEISSGWIRDIRRHVKVAQTCVAKVLRVDEKKGHVSLSLKRVSMEQRRDKLKEYKLEQKAKKMLELISKQINKDRKACEEVEGLLVNRFGSVYNSFKTAVEKPSSLDATLKDRREWINPIKDIAKKSIEQKEFEFKAELRMSTNKEDGVNLIKNILINGINQGLNVNYLSAPVYMVKYKTKHAKKGEKEFQDKLSALIKNAKKEGIEASFKVR